MDIWVENLKLKQLVLILGIDQDFEVETFTWEKLDCQEEIKSAFNI